MRTVADRRFADAEYLESSRKNQHANGAMYLGGFVIECLLKALLLKKYGWLEKPVDPAHLSDHDRKLHSLCYREHDLAGILDCMPELKLRLSKLRVLRALELVCGSWTVFARYSPHSATMDDAGDFLGRVRDVKKWLR